ncbi:hypothetical protein [Agromyces sp. GXS1127]|uniref:hypothetical protein n=1 Tax=Agromyces sp. GXS1127 TaxID=3424181 RepID=UPI003D315345
MLDRGERTMNVISLEFAGYLAGEVDFGPVRDRHPVGPGTVRDQLDEAVQRIASTVEADGAFGQFAGLTVVGFSDRNDTPGLSCDQRRASESSASFDRAGFAWQWLQQAVADQLVTPRPDWWDSSGAVTWFIVPTGAAILEHDPPTSEAERRRNRRVKFVFSFFGPA